MVYTSAIAKDNDLFKAAYDGNISQVKQLLAKNKTKVNAKDEEGVTALILASQNGHVKVVKALLAAGANVNIQAANGDTALYISSQNGHTNVVQALLAAKADVNIKSFDGGATALFIASQKGHTDVVALLVTKVDVNLKKDDGFTALIMASQEGRLKVVQALLAAKADVNIKSPRGTTALIIASQDGHVEVVQTLLANGADVNSQNDTGGTALLMASHQGHTDVVQQLLAAGADVNLKAQGTYTALMVASQQGHEEIVELLKAVATKEVIPPEPTVKPVAVPLPSNSSTVDLIPQSSSASPVVADLLPNDPTVIPSVPSVDSVAAPLPSNSSTVGLNKEQNAGMLLWLDYLPIFIIGIALLSSIYALYLVLISYRVGSLIKKLKYGWSSKQAIDQLVQIGSRAIPSLIKALADKDSDVRPAAANVLGQIGPAAIAAITALIQGLGSTDTDFGKAAAKALEKIDPKWRKTEEAKAAIPALIQRLDSTDTDFGKAAAKALDEIDPKWRNTEEAKAAIPALIHRLGSTYMDFSKAAVRALDEIDPQWHGTEKAAAVVPVLVAVLTDKSLSISGNIHAAEVLLKIRPAKAAVVIPVLVAVLTDKSLDKSRSEYEYMYLAGQVAKLLGKIGPAATAAIPALIQVLANTNSLGAIDIKIALLALDGHSGTSSPVVGSRLESFKEEFEKLELKGELRRLGFNSFNRCLIVMALGKLGPAAIHALKQVLADRDSDVRKAATDALDKIDPQWRKASKATDAIPVLKPDLVDQMQYFEQERPDGDGLCSWDPCPCGSFGSRIPRGTGHVYIPQSAVDFRRDCLTWPELMSKLNRKADQLPPGTRFIFTDVPVLVCEQGLDKLNIDTAVAAADAKHWWATGSLPLRATPPIP